MQSVAWVNCSLGAHCSLWCNNNGVGCLLKYGNWNWLYYIIREPRPTLKRFVFLSFSCALLDGDGGGGGGGCSPVANPFVGCLRCRDGGARYIVCCLPGSLILNYFKTKENLISWRTKDTIIQRAASPGISFRRTDAKNSSLPLGDTQANAVN